MEKAKKSKEMWFVRRRLRVSRRAINQNALECCRTESFFCMITPVPTLLIWWGVSFRYLAGKHFNILHTDKIFPLVTSTFSATWRKTFMDVGFIRTRKSKSGWGCGSFSHLSLSTRLELIVSSPSGINYNMPSPPYCKIMVLSALKKSTPLMKMGLIGLLTS